MKKLFTNIFYLFLPIILGSLVGLLISNQIDYQNLIKPPLAPPKIFFPIAWTIIYLLMGISYFILKRNIRYTEKESIIYYLQLFFNLLWSIIFFILKWRLVAILWIITLDLLVFYMIYLFYDKKPISAWLNIFYALWITFATYLSIGIYLLN